MMTEQEAAILKAALDEVERLRDIITREAWLEEARSNEVPGPYVPWDVHTKALDESYQKGRVSVFDEIRAYLKEKP